MRRRSASRRNTNCSKFFANVISRHPVEKQQSWMNSLPSLAVIASMLFDCSPELILWSTSHPPCPGGSIPRRSARRHRTLGSCRSHLREASESHPAWSHLGAGAERASGCRSDRPATPLAVSPATIDRLLAPIRGTAGRRRKCKPATKSSRQIPIRTFADWKEPEPGFLEVDFVAHCGDSMQGTFLWSLVATDVCSGWTEAVPLVAREQFLVIEGLAVMPRQFPVPIRGIDTDNDSAFINETLQG